MFLYKFINIFINGYGILYIETKSIYNDNPIYCKNILHLNYIYNLKKEVII